jgi:hypothetical protein
MNRRPSDPIFLERSSYRQRRLRDAARMMPIFGIVLMLFPLLSGSGGLTSGVGVYLFGVWFLLIILSAFLSNRVKQDAPAPKADV